MSVYRSRESQLNIFNRCALACSMAASLLSPVSEPVVLHKEYITSQQESQEQTWFEQGRQRWEKRIGKPITAQLVLVSGNAEVLCDTGEGLPLHLSADALPMFCLADNRVVISALSVQALAREQNDGLLRRFNNAHELGHAVQYAEKLLATAPQTDTLPAIEKQATCYAGMDMAKAGALQPGEVQQLEQYLSVNSGDTAHGTGNDQAAAFARGVSGGQC